MLKIVPVFKVKKNSSFTKEKSQLSEAEVDYARQLLACIVENSGRIYEGCYPILLVPMHYRQTTNG